VCCIFIFLITYFHFVIKKIKQILIYPNVLIAYSQVSQKIKIKIIFGLKNKIHGVFYYFYTELKKIYLHAFWI